MAAALPIALALALASRFAPAVAPDTLLTFAQQESGLRPFAIHDNDTGRSYDPETAGEAVALAVRLVLRERHSVDLGLMQVNFRGPTREGLAIRDAFDPGLSMRTGAAILTAAYGACDGPAARTGAQRAAALRCAASRYNTGSDSPVGQRYAARIWQTAEHLVPSIGKVIADFPHAAPGSLLRDIEARHANGSIAPDRGETPAPRLIYVKPARAGRELVFSERVARK